MFTFVCVWFRASAASARTSIKALFWVRIPGMQKVSKDTTARKEAEKKKFEAKLRLRQERLRQSQKEQNEEEVRHVAAAQAEGAKQQEGVHLMQGVKDRAARRTSKSPDRKKSTNNRC